MRCYFEAALGPTNGKSIMQSKRFDLLKFNASEAMLCEALKSDLFTATLHSLLLRLHRFHTPNATIAGKPSKRMEMHTCAAASPKKSAKAFDRCKRNDPKPTQRAAKKITGTQWAS
eukprot:scaffold210842_cov20-Prasinocladus_malaysianus.AAC.1